MKSKKVSKNIPHIKNPKKVAAGKARAAKSLRVNGKFTGNEFFAKVEKDAQSAGQKDVFTFFLQNEKQYTALYDTPLESAEVYDYQFMNNLLNYTGNVIMNGRDNKNLYSLKKVMVFNQFLKNSMNVAAWSIKPFIKLSGELSFELPDIEQLEGMDTEELEDFLLTVNITIIISEKKNRIRKYNNMYKKETIKDAKKA